MTFGVPCFGWQEFGGQVSKKSIYFRPVRPRLKENWAFLVISVILIALMLSAILAPKPQSAYLLLATFVLWSGGLYLICRNRFPGDPTLVVSEEGVLYKRGRRVQKLSWDEVDQIVSDGTLNLMTFVAKPGRTSISMYPEMVSADGRQWSMLIEDYWQPNDALARAE